MERCEIMKNAVVTSTVAEPSGSLPLWRRPIPPVRFFALVLVSAAVVGGVALSVYHYNKDRYDSASRPPGSAGGSITLPMPVVFSVDEDTYSLIPKEEVFRGGPPKDGIPALTGPQTVPQDEADLSPDDRVIGVSIGGESRAYPLRILNWHEIANDELGGRQIAVTYCPLCDSSAVFDRDIGGEVREFGVSGLLYNSNVLMYDKQDDESQESLWSQMLFKAVTGPAAREGLELSLLPAQVTTWEAWRRQHPDTTSLSFDTGHFRNYGSNPYAQYFATDELVFPVAAVGGQEAEDTGTIPPKEPVLIVSTDGALKGYPASSLQEALASDAEKITDTFGGKTFHFRPVHADRGIFEVTDAEGNLVPVAHSFWFEFRAMHPHAEVFKPVASAPSEEASLVRPATKETFDSLVLEVSSRVLVDFWAEWCGICARLKPIVEEVAGQRRETLTVVSVEVDQQPVIAERYEITSLPTLAIFSNGELVAERTGFLDEEGLTKFLDEHGP